MLSLHGAMTLYCFRNISFPHYPPCVEDTHGPERKESSVAGTLAFLPVCSIECECSEYCLGQCFFCGRCITTLFGVLLTGTRLCSVLFNSPCPTLCVLYLRDSAKRLGFSRASHRDGVLLLLRYCSLENR